MIPLDPPFADRATVGGVVAANCSGPRRRLCGTARDMVIGMKFATVTGKLVDSGGMVVKNVAGLDMAKLIIGSFGTLAALAAVNFKLVPMPPASRTFVLSFDSAAEAIKSRDRILNGVLQPAAIDLLNPQAARRAGSAGFVLLIQAGGNPAVLDRYGRELNGAPLEGDAEAILWTRVREFTPEFLAQYSDAAVVRVSGLLSQVGSLVESFDGPVVARAGSGVCYGYFAAAEGAADWIRKTVGCGWKAVIEFAPAAIRDGLDLWPDPGGDLELMRRIKSMFDASGVLNAGRLYGRI
jgi:glycolate oxidase FAD binding subunit